jgi:hypothetical protein
MNFRISNFDFRLIAILVAAMAFSSCATQHKTYRPPSNVKLEASTKRLAAAVEKATSTAERARGHVEAARKAADKEATSSASVLTQLDDLLKVLPSELKAKGDALKEAVVHDQIDIGEIVTHVDGAQREHGQLGKDLFEANAAKLQVEVDKREYYANAGKLAKDATDEREARIKAEAQLVKEKWIRILWKIGGGFVVLLIIAGVVLFFTGKLGVVLAKIGIKAAV